MDNIHILNILKKTTLHNLFILIMNYARDIKSKYEQEQIIYMLSIILNKSKYIDYYYNNIKNKKTNKIYNNIEILNSNNNKIKYTKIYYFIDKLYLRIIEYINQQKLIKLLNYLLEHCNKFTQSKKDIFINNFNLLITLNDNRINKFFINSKSLYRYKSNNSKSNKSNNLNNLNLPNNRNNGLINFTNLNTESYTNNNSSNKFIKNTKKQTRLINKFKSLFSKSKSKTKSTVKKNSYINSAMLY